MASGSTNFVPLPFFMDESGGDDKKNEFGGPFGGAAPAAFNPATSFDKQEALKQSAEPSSAALPTDFFSSSFTASTSYFSAPSNIEVPAPASSFSFGQTNEASFNPVSAPAIENKQEIIPQSFPPVEPQSIEPAAAPTGFTSQPFIAPSFETAQPWQPAQVSVPEAPKQQEPWASSFTQPSTYETPKLQEAWTPPVSEPWKPDVTHNQAVETNSFVPKVEESFYKATEQPSHISWQTPMPSAPRRSSIDSQHSNPSITMNPSVSAPPSISLPPYQHGLDALEETLSTRSFTNSSFVIEGGKACDRCAKQNEFTANFCCRCGAQIGSPIESPSDSGVFSVDSSALVFEQMGRLSISEKHVAVSNPFSPSSAGLNQPFAFTQPSSFNQPSSFDQPASLPGAFSQPIAQQHQQPQHQIQQHGQFVPQSAVVSPTKPAAPSRVHPVMSFGFGGSFVMTFPTLQTRYNPNGQPINSYRPSMVYKGDIDMLPQAKAKITESILAIDNGAPLLEKAQKPKELSALIAKLKSDGQSNGDKLLFGLFELILKSSGKPLDSPHVLDNLKELLADSLASEQHHTSIQSTHGVFGLNEVGQKVISGDIIGASETAINHQLWSHALLLGQFAGPQHYQKVVGQFVQQDFPPSHPVRLVYLMLSGQVQLIGQELAAAGPALGKSWASTLLALVANRKSPIDNALLVNLGDALAKNNDTSSAQFCYLLSQDETIFSTGRVKSIGSGDFVGVLRMTEAYEAVRYSMNPNFCLPHLFPLKMAFVSMLLELGLNSLALRHCNALGSLLKKSQWKDARFLEAFDALVNRLEVFAEGNPSIAVPSAAEGSGWFPKVGGLMDVLDRVIGVEDSGKSSPSKKSLKSPILPQVDVAAEPAMSSYQTPVGGFDPFASSRGSFSAPAPWEQIPQPVAPIKDVTEAYLQKHEHVEAAPNTGMSTGFKPEMPRNQAWSPTPEATPAWQPAEVKQMEPAQPWQQQSESQPWQQSAQLATQPTAQPAWQQSEPVQPAWQSGQPWQPAGAQQASRASVPNQFGGQNQSWETPAGQFQAPGGPSGQFQAPNQFQAPGPQFSQPPSQQFNQGPGQFNQVQAPGQQFSPAMGPVSPQKAPSTPNLMHQASMPNLPAAMEAAPVDDFGFANAPAVKRSETPTGTTKTADADADSNKDSDVGSKSSLLGGFLGGLFKRKQNASSPALSSGSAGSNGSNGPVKANLGESEMKLVYDEVKKQWVRKDTGAPPVAEVAAPPPPPSMGAQSASDSGSPMSYRRGQAGGPRGKYVDAFGAETTTPAPSAPRVNLIPTPSFTNLSLDPQAAHMGIPQMSSGAPQEFQSQLQQGQTDQQYQPQSQFQAQQPAQNMQPQFQGHAQPQFQAGQYQGNAPQGTQQPPQQYQGQMPQQPQQQYQAQHDPSQQQFQGFGQSPQAFNPQQPPQHQQQQPQYSYGNFNPTGPSGGPFYQ